MGAIQEAIEKEKERSGGPAADKTLRDEIATAAMVGIISRERWPLMNGQKIEGELDISVAAYKFADAMIEESRK